ncbi:MAG TPA: XdhC/CoxI family protein [Bacteroidetes bacterium]|nr:XdhC/CoxI family protein [Bacteroidota bacterium]
MKELLETIENWTDQKKPFAIATVIKTWGSSPRPVGSSLLVSESMEMAGSVSGGCVEGAVIKAALPLIENGAAHQLQFGVTNEEAWTVGLTCGGKVTVFVERFMAFDDRPEEQAVWEKLHLCLRQNEPCVLLSKLVDGKGAHSLVLPDGQTVGHAISEALKKETLRAYGERKNQVIELGRSQYFAQIFPRKSQMLIIGAAHITAHLVQLASLYHFETIVIDPRGVFANKTQFVHPPDQLFEKYPSEVLSGLELDAYTYAVILSHDPKIDDNALHVLLKSKVGYIGALGSRKTHAKRVARLQVAGFSENEIGRVRAPVGVDINAKSPGEIALSVMAEIIKTKNEFL